MRKIFFFLGLTLTALVLTGAGCLSIGGGKPVALDGGVFKSIDRGETWAPKTQIFAVGGERKDFSRSAIGNLMLDPSDHNAIYAAGEGTGLLFSYNGGNGWQQPEQLKAGTVGSLAVDFKNKCVIYLTLGNLILRSDDCNRGFAPIYQEGRPETFLTALAIDPFNSSVIYAGNSAGDFLASSDRGKSWVVGRRFENPLVKIIINPLNSKIIYAATREKGIYRTGDAGVSWVDLNQGLKQYGGAFDFKNLILTDAKSESLLLSSQYGLIKTGDAGVTWQALSLLTPPNTADIKVAAVNPQNSKEIYYSTPTTFYKSMDGGEKWVTKKLPSSRPPAFLLIDTVDPKVMYLGFGAAPKK
ncbi:MAG: hypothetical protein HY982_00710 [Candidatus Magasanikbacteria bacterium]|nr:hypothetical protein [Candidatus Magasanikbacteria bacterium]